jgi:cardiolipin synthase
MHIPTRNPRVESVDIDSSEREIGDRYPFPDGAWRPLLSRSLISAIPINEEVNAVILSREFAIEMEKMFARDLAKSDPIRWEDWKKRPLLSRIRERLAHLFSHWP